MAEALGHLFNGKLREAVQTSIAVIKRSSNPKVGSDIKDPLLSTLEQISVYIPETGSVSDTEQQEITTLVNTGVLGNIAYGAHKKMVDSRDLLETQSEKEREILKEFPTQLYDLAIALGYQPPVSSTLANQPSMNQPSVNQPSTPMNQPSVNQPSTPMNQPSMNRPSVNQPSTPMNQPSMNQPSPMNQPLMNQPSTPMNQPSMNQPSTPMNQPSMNQPSTPMNQPSTLVNVNRSTNTNTNTKPLAIMNRSNANAKLLAIENVDRSTTNTKPLAIMNRSTANTKPLAIMNRSTANAKLLENVNRSTKSLAIMNRSTANTKPLADTVSRTKELLKKPFSSLRNTFKRGLNVNSMRKKMPKAPLLLTNKDADVSQELQSLLPGSSNVQSKNENTTEKATEKTTEKVTEKATRGNALPIRLQSAWGNTKPISKIGKIQDIWRNPAQTNNPFASKQNREMQKRETMARRKAALNFSKRLTQKAKAKIKRKSV